MAPVRKRLGTVRFRSPALLHLGGVLLVLGGAPQALPQSPGGNATNAPVAPESSSRRSNDPGRWWGPLLAEFDLTLHPGTGIDAAGPIWGRRESDGISTWRFSPVIAYESEPMVERTEWEFLYPLVSYDRFGTEWKVHLLQMAYLSGGGTVDGEIKERQTIFPFFFRQSSTRETNDYIAIVPFYGRLKNRLFRDEVRFAALPIWLETRKRGVVTENWLFPFFHTRRGGGVSGWQVWPLVGHETKEPTVRTNVIDEPEVVPGHQRWFTLWPFVLSDRSGLGGPNPVTNLFLFPTHLRTRSPQMDHTWWFFFTHRTNRVAKFEEWAYPWPFFGHARGPGKHANRIFPLWGRAASATQQSDFVGWPFYTHRRTRNGTLDRERHRLLYFGYSDLREEDTASGKAFRRRDLWPLFTWRHERDGRERLQILAPIEGILPNNKSVERLYSPVWSVWRHESNPGTQSSAQSFLWNLWRREKRGDDTRASAVFGLVQTQKLDGRRTWRILGIGPRAKPFNPPAAPTGASPRRNAGLPGVPPGRAV